MSKVTDIETYIYDEIFFEYFNEFSIIRHLRHLVNMMVVVDGPLCISKTKQQPLSNYSVCEFLREHVFSTRSILFFQFVARNINQSIDHIIKQKQGSRTGIINYSYNNFVPTDAIIKRVLSLYESFN